ncbi:MAG TPA: hypothetical protein VKT52_04420 [Ktedonobacterales bacterium]|nr:hypothetical protein [Ktedonobacterales bacterium]
MATSMGSQQTGTQNDVYDLVSVLYHALEGAQTNGQYCQDARQSGNRDLEQFFLQCQQEDRQRADRAKQLLGRIVQG